MGDTNNSVISTLIEDKIIEADKLNIKANRGENAFSYIMEQELLKEDDDDITQVGKVDKDFYYINRTNDSSIGCYSTRLTVDLKSLD